MHALAGITYLVTKLDTVSRRKIKVPINELASSPMACRTFTRYRTIDIDMKKELVKTLDWE